MTPLSQGQALVEPSDALHPLDLRRIPRNLPSSEYKLGDEFKPFHPSASHIPPEYRDGWNRCWLAASHAAPTADLRAAPEWEKHVQTVYLAARTSPHCATVPSDVLEAMRATLLARHAAAQLAAVAAPPAEPDMPAICAALGFDPTNHHNADKCPYCSQQRAALVHPAAPGSSQPAAPQLDTQRANEGMPAPVWQERLHKLEQQLRGRGERLGGLTWAPGAEALTQEHRANSLADALEAQLRGDYTEMFFTDDDEMLSGAELVQRLKQRDPGAMWDRFIESYRVGSGFSEVKNLLGSAAWFRRQFVAVNSAGLTLPAVAQADQGDVHPAAPSSPSAQARPLVQEQGESGHGELPVRAEMEKDAARYRWLRDGEISAEYPYPVMRTGGDRWTDRTIWAEELDAAIDAAMSAPGGGGRA